jgi:ligand-binding SRPBCC domain-containing protein
MYAFSITSELNAPPEAVWESVHTFKGVNAELRPFARMTAPPGMQERTFEDVPVGQTVLCSWIMAFGFIPMDKYCLKLDAVGNYYFRENFTSTLQRTWQHHRTIVRNAGGSQLTDDVCFQPRLPLIGRVMLPVFKLVFRNRHRYLRQKFNN